MQPKEGLRDLDPKWVHLAIFFLFDVAPKLSLMENKGLSVASEGFLFWSLVYCL